MKVANRYMTLRFQFFVTSFKSESKHFETCNSFTCDSFVSCDDEPQFGPDISTSRKGSTGLA